WEIPSARYTLAAQSAKAGSLRPFSCRAFDRSASVSAGADSVSLPQAAANSGRITRVAAKRVFRTGFLSQMYHLDAAVIGDRPTVVRVTPTHVCSRSHSRAATRRSIFREDSHPSSVQVQRGRTAGDPREPN